MGIVRGAHTNEWGDSFHRSGGLVEGAPETLMVPYPTWRGLPLPRSLMPVARRPQQPLVPEPWPGTYGNAAVARMMAGGARHHSSSTSSQRTVTITSQPRLHATAATRATNVRALAPSGPGAPQNPTASTSSSPCSSILHGTVHPPHRPQASDAIRTTGVPAPSGAGTQQSPRHERASKRAAQRHEPQHHAATATREHRASPAGRRTMPSHTNMATAGARPEERLGTVRPQTSPGPGPTGDPGPQPQTPPDASTCGQQPAAPTPANLEPHSHHSPPVRPNEGPRHVPSEGPPTQTCTATPTDATSARPERPLGTIRPHAHIPIGSPSPQAPATPSTSAPGYHPPAPAQAEPAPQQRHHPQAGQAVRPTETASGSQPAPGPDPDPDPTHATVAADALLANAPGRELLTGIRNPKGGTPAVRPAAAEGNGGTRVLAGHVGRRPRPAPAPDGQTRAATQLADDAATPPAPPAQPQREGPTVDATEEAWRPPQRKEVRLPAYPPAQGPPRAEIPSRTTDQPKN